MTRLAPPPGSSPLDRVLDRAVAAHNADPHRADGRALAGLPLRFGPPTPEAPAQPAAGADWTLAETLGEIERRGVRLVMSSRGLRVRHAHRLPDVARNAAHHEAALALWLSLRQRPAPAPFDAREWDPAVRLHAAWFALCFEAPPTPFALRPGETVVDASLLRAGLAGRLAAGPLAPSAVRLRSELSALFERYALTQRDAVPGTATEPETAPRRLAA